MAVAVSSLHTLSPSPLTLSPITDNLGLWVLVGIACYWLAVIQLRRLDVLPSYVGAQGPLLTIHTKRGREFLERLSGPKRFWRACANLGVGVAIAVMVGAFVMFVTIVFAVLQAPQPTAINQPRNVIAIPGVNDFLPLSVAPEIVAGLVVALVVHEGAHGLLCRVEDIEIESMGLVLLAILPIGAFVEPDQRSSKEADRGALTRMFAAGVTANFAVTVVAFALLFGPVAGAIAVAPGASVGGVVPHSPAADAGLEPNDRITAIDGVAIETNDDLERALADVPADADAVEIERNDGETLTVELALTVTGSLEEGPAVLDLGDRIVAVDGDPVTTQRAFLDAVSGTETVELTVESGETGEREVREIPTGAAVAVAPDGPLAAAGAPTDRPLIVTGFDGASVSSSDDLTALFAETDAGQVVTVSGYVGDERVSYEVTLGEVSPNTGGGTVGVFTSQGVSGIAVDDVGVQLYPAEAYLSAIGGDADDDTFGAFADSFLGKIGIALFLPIVSILEILPYNFAGFTGGVENFYQVTGPLALLGTTGVFFLANLLFWTGWINVQVAFFNCIPAFPLDGGHILRTSTEAVVSRLPIEATRGMVRIVTTSVGLLMLASLLLALFGPRLLA
ncbi:site-2 protease family protein [Natronobiforma cellulositropha]|uniref:site-2 protease family protein n=1 Tax=Natronobiforma cellulositropha TaxID=1679076 RepID=UPI0021D5B599|nr:site-2 protease family protein [Natronobiforma cellulositropha]